MNYAQIFTDFSQLSMAYSYWKTGKADRIALFHLHCHKIPFPRQYAISCGLANIVQYLQNLTFWNEDLHYLTTIVDDNNKPIITEPFLNYLRKLKFSCDLDAFPEGNLIFEDEPILSLRGPLIQCQLLKPLLAKVLEIATLMATQTSNLNLAAAPNTLLAYNSINLAYSANANSILNYAAYIGGTSYTSDLTANKIYHLPLVGIMQPTWVKSFASEIEAFQNFATIADNQTVLRLDTYEWLDGLANAIKIGTELRRRRQDLFGVYLDLENVVKLSNKVRKNLDQAGFTNTKIVTSGELSEKVIKNLRKLGAKIDIWGSNQAAIALHKSLHMNYQLIALYDLEFSDSENTEDRQQVRRFMQNNKIIRDIIYHVEANIPDFSKRKKCWYYDLLQPIFRNGDLVYHPPEARMVRNQTTTNVQNFLKYNHEKIPAIIKN